MRRYLLALDQGSASSRAVAFDLRGRILTRAQIPIATGHPRPGWVEQQPQEILASQLACMQRVLRDLRGAKPLALGIANQRSTILIWDRKTGKPLSPGLSWQDRRTAAWCQRLREKSGERMAEVVREKTGLLLTPYYAASKLAWLLDHRPGARRKAERGDLLCGTVNTFLIWHLTRGRAHVTDHTNAARTLLMDLAGLKWDPELLRTFGIPPQILPAIVPTCAPLGEAVIGKDSVPIWCSIGDQQAASLGTGSVEPGDITLNYGTGGFALLNTGDRARFLPGLLTSIAWSTPRQTCYLLEGTVNSVGSALDWLGGGLGLFRNPAQIASMYRRSRNPAWVVPAFTGLGAPYWRPEVSAHFFGLDHRTRPDDLVRGVTDGIAYLMRDILEAMRPARRRAGSAIRAGGGLARLDPLIQFQSDLLQTSIERPAVTEATALGAAFLAGMGCGVWKHPQQIRALIRTGRIFTPRLTRREADGLYARWKALITLALQS